MLHIDKGCLYNLNEENRIMLSFFLLSIVTLDYFVKFISSNDLPFFSDVNALSALWESDLETLLIYKDNSVT